MFNWVIKMYFINMNIQNIKSALPTMAIDIWQVLFFTQGGRFNWLSITSIVAIVTFIWSIIYNKKKLKADLISKARLNWMDKVRSLYAAYIEAFGEYRYLYSEVFVEKDRDKKELDNKMVEVRKLYYELELYIPSNKSNSDLLKYINLMWYELSYISDYYNYGRQHDKIVSVKTGVKRSNYETVVDEYLDRLIEEAYTLGNHFFKEEWEKVKKGN